jgi:hypothetical protein
MGVTICIRIRELETLPWNLRMGMRNEEGQGRTRRDSEGQGGTRDEEDEKGGGRTRTRRDKDEEGGRRGHKGRAGAYFFQTGHILTWQFPRGPEISSSNLWDSTSRWIQTPRKFFFKMNKKNHVAWIIISELFFLLLTWVVV